MIGDLLETQSSEMPQQNHFTLIVGQFIDQSPQVLSDLAAHQQLLNIVIGKFFTVEKIHFRIVIGYGVHLFLFPEMIDNQVMRDTDHPRQKSAIVTVPSISQGLDHFYKSLLEQILRKGLIFDSQENIGVNLCPVSVYQRLNTSFITM